MRQFRNGKGTGAMRRFNKRGRSIRRGERGAALVEMAFVMILLVMMVLGIVEFGYLFGQYNEIRHGAHEGARLAAVDDANLGANTCASMQLAAEVNVDFTDSPGGTLGEQASVTVEIPNPTSLSGVGLIEVFLPASLSTTADFRLEQNSDNWDNDNQDQIPCGP